MVFPFEADLALALQEREQVALYRRRVTLTSACDTQVQTGSRELLQFCSNDYLGLANHPRVIAAMTAAAERYGVGSGASHLVSGHSGLHHELEQRLAEITQRPRALLFSTGYMANLGTIQALVSKGDAVVEDKLNHASLIDGGLHSGAAFYRYRHNDVAHLRSRLEGLDCKRKLVVTDGVFSMDGDCADIPALSRVCQEQSAALMVDDAHGFGVLNQGRGVSIYDLDTVPIYMATLGKAVGCYGAFVAGSETLIETLIQFARPYIYTTALPPAVAAAAISAMELLQDEAWRFDVLADRICEFKAQASHAGFALMPSDTAIQPLLVGSADQAIAWSDALRDQGYWVTAIRPPTVPVGKARLRITLSANHSRQQVRGLVDALIAVRQRFPLETPS